MTSGVSISENDRALYGLPSDYKVGQAVADGSCFFDSFRQGLMSLGGYDPVTLKDLRDICADAGRNPPDWLVELLSHSQVSPTEVRSETPAEYVERVLDVVNLSWGEPEIEGRILCERFKVQLVVLEAHSEFGVTRILVTEQRVESIDVPFNLPKTIYIINRGTNHFEPLLRINSENLGLFASNLEVSESDEDSRQQKSDIEVENTQFYADQLGESNFDELFEYTQVTATSEKKFSPSNNRKLIEIHDFEKVHRAILDCDIPQLEMSLADHRNSWPELHPEYELIVISFQDAILYSNTKVLDILYDHWSSAVPTSQFNNYIQNLKQIGKALIEICDDQPINHTILNAYCLAEYNMFQIQLYRDLLDLQLTPTTKSQETPQQKVQNIKDILITAIDIYIEFSSRTPIVSNTTLIEKLSLDKFIDLFMDIGSKHSKNFALYNLFELCHRKLDFCIISFILKYIHALKLRLKLPMDTYQEMECAVYYFVYRLNEEWRLYLSESWIKRRQDLLYSNNISEYFKVLCDAQRLADGPLVYLEWLKFKESVTKFKDILEKTSINDNIREEKLTYDEVQSLTLLPYLRDEYSLQKIVMYLETCSENIRRYPVKTKVLVVQRVLQVTGELLKSTDKTLHLSPTTKALLQINIPHSVFQQLTTLRDDFSKIRDGKLIRRIHLEESNPDVILETINDLDHIRKAIIEVIAIYKPVVEKSLIEKGFNLVAECQRKLTLSISDYITIIQKNSFGVDPENYIDSMKEKEDSLTEEDWIKLGTEKSVFRELSHLVHHTISLKKEHANRDGNCIKNMINNLPTYIEYIHNILKVIENNTIRWHSFKNYISGLPFKCSISDEPDKECIKQIKKIITKKSHPDLTSTLQETLERIVIDWSLEWSIICDFLKFIIQEFSVITNHPREIKRGEFTTQLSEIIAGHPNSEGITNVRRLLDLIKQITETYCTKNNISMRVNKPNAYNYKGLDHLTKSMSKKRFIISKEADYLRDNVGKCTCSNKKCNHQALVEKILSGEQISPKERDLARNQIAMDDKCQEIIENLVIGNDRNGCSLLCLVNRTKILKTVIGTSTFPKLVQKYYQDNGFRLIMEAIVADIHILLYGRGLWRLLDTSRSPLLIDYPLRNILQHGNPLLDVIGEKLDSSSAVDTFLKFALRIVADEPILSKLLKLHDQGVKREQVRREWNGPITPSFQDYLSLLQSEGKEKVESLVNVNTAQSSKTTLIEPNLSKDQQSITTIASTATTSSTLVTSGNSALSVPSVSNTILSSAPSILTAVSETLTAPSTTPCKNSNEEQIPNKITSKNVLDVGSLAASVASAASAAASAASAAASAASAAAIAAASVATVAAQLATLQYQS